MKFVMDMVMMLLSMLLVVSCMLLVVSGFALLDVVLLDAHCINKLRRKFGMGDLE